MNARLKWAAWLSIAVIPLLGIGLLDPLEGLGALLLGIALGAVVRVLSKERFPKLAWISFVVALTFLALAIGLAISELLGAPTDDTSQAGISTVVIVTLWLGRLAELPMIAGLVIYTVRLFRRSTSQTDRS